jgi:hypothetical protein
MITRPHPTKLCWSTRPGVRFKSQRRIGRVGRMVEHRRRDDAYETDEIASGFRWSSERG